MHECMCIFCGEYACIATSVVSTMHLQVYTLNRCCEHQRTHLRTRSSQGVHMRSCMCSVFIQRWEQRVRGLSWSVRTLVAWCGELCMTEEEIGELSVSFLFLRRVGVYVAVGVYTNTHTHTAHMRYSIESPGVGMRHLEGPKNPDGPNLSEHVLGLPCKCGSVRQSKELFIPRSSVRFCLKPEKSNSHGFDLHRPSIKGTKLLLKVIKADIIIIICICVQSTQVYVCI